MRFSVASGTDNALLQIIADNTEPFAFPGFLQVLRAYGPTGLAPHGVTQRWTYTVPVNKIARVDLVDMGLHRQSSSTTLGNHYCRIVVTPNGESDSPIMSLHEQEGSPEKVTTKSASPKIILLAGDEIEYQTGDSGVGGSVFHWGHAFISEFDA